MSDAQAQDNTSMLVRVVLVEQQLKQVQVELKECVQADVNKVQIEGIQSTIKRVEDEVSKVKTALETQEKNTKAFLLRVGYIILTAIGAIGLAVITGYINYFLTH